MRRALPIALGVVIVVGGVLGLQAYFANKDKGSVASESASGPGTLEADHGADHVKGAGVGKTANPPPTSGPHEPRNVTGEKSVDDATLLTALEVGDVVIAYPQAQPAAALKQLQEDVSGRFDAELSALGQMVVLVRRPGLVGIQGLAWRRRLDAQSPDDPKLREFADAWLGKGVGKTE
jgi:uncharacterized protein DUF3105